MTSDDIANLGPLAPLAGTWEGVKGDDVSPAGDRSHGTNRYREHLELEPIGRVDNHEQILYGLRYRTTAWRVGEDDPFHEEVGYWLWDAKNQQVMRCFIVPRGISVIAGGTVASDAKAFELRAEVGSDTYGICSNLFLDAEFKTTAYVLKVEIHDDGSWSYDEDTVMAMPGKPDPFHHTDKNRLTRA